MAPPNLSDSQSHRKWSGITKNYSKFQIKHGLTIYIKTGQFYKIHNVNLNLYILFLS